MAEQKSALPVSNVEVLLALIERGSREAYKYVSEPPQTFNVEGLRSHFARLYSYCEELVGIAEAARAQDQANAEKNGTAPADQVN